MSEFNLKIRSAYLSGPVDVTVIAPGPRGGEDPAAFYRSDRTFPVLWMLHGGYSGFADWVTYDSVPRYAADRDVIMVAPVAPNSDFSNQPEIGEGFFFEDFFIQELVPMIRNWFHGSADPADNMISGNSMGCAAAWRYGLKYPEIFGHIGALSNQPLDYSYLEPYRGLTNLEFRELVKTVHVPTVYGIDSQGLHAKELNNICRFPTVGAFLDSIENTWARFDEAAANGKLQDVFLPGSIEKIWGPGISKFKEHCDRLGIDKVTFDLYEGRETHNAQFWDYAVECFLEHCGFHKLT